jgi:alpha/beta superfamily hydrolase
MKRAEELIQVIPGADHFFWGKEGEIEKLLVSEYPEPGSPVVPY